MASYRLVLHHAVVEEIQALPAPVKERAKAAIDALAHEPRPHGASRLKGRANAYRLRVGDYRIVYAVHATEVVVYVIGAAHRKEVYARLLRRR